MAMSHLEPTFPRGTVEATSAFTSSSDASTPASFDRPAAAQASPAMGFASGCMSLTGYGQEYSGVHSPHKL